MAGGQGFYSTGLFPAGSREAAPTSVGASARQAGGCTQGLVTKGCRDHWPPAQAGPRMPPGDRPVWSPGAESPETPAGPQQGAR